MILMVGLGNPGAKYAGNRHNVGFMAVDRIAADHGFSPWKPRFQGLAAEGRLGDSRVTLLKPQGYMNLSGQSVGEAMRYLKLTPAEVVVLHDELDLAPGVCRLKTGGGHAGHNGLRSIHQHVGEGYRRLRIGIGHPGHKDRVTGHVLSDFAKAEQPMLEDLLRGISDGAAALARGDGAAFGTALAARMAPPKPPRPAAPPVPADPAKATPTPTAPEPRTMTDRLRSLADRFR
ncbi:aminoacyl-tRNA hydrolase [Paracoccus sp. SJTW-4]|uniref:aminoacyl-tRNA hydrolase n=1 Tax=Paracoccus sp. SJTW-4 TaxID=3078428 RepID=UPI0039EC6F8A